MSANIDKVLGVDCWRGQCLNYFARSEAAVSKSLDAAQAVGKISTIKHLAGQRLAELVRISEELSGTSKQITAFANALRIWQSIESKRQFLAHGVAAISHDPQGQWVALFDLVTYRANNRTEERWAIRQSEAEIFLSELAAAFKSLSGQLGHFRKRIAEA